MTRWRAGNACGWTYRSAGAQSRPTVVLLHGFLGSARDWDNVVERWAGRFRCLAFDLPGHGASPAWAHVPRGGLSAVAAGLESALDALGVSRAGLVGYSMGGRLALQLIARTPARWCAAVAASASAGLRGVAARRARRRRDGALASQLLSMRMTDFVDAWYARPLFAPLRARPGFAALAARRVAEADACGLAWALRAMGAGRQGWLVPALGRAPVPLLMLAGRLDARYCRLAAAVAAGAPRGRAGFLTGAGHCLHLEVPGEFARRAGGFLGGILCGGRA